MKFGIEGGGSAGIGVVVSSGPSLNIGPAIGGLRGGLDMFKSIAPIGQIRFDEKSGLNAADAVLEAQSILAQGRPQQTGTEVPEIFQKGLDINLDPTKSSTPQLDTFSPPINSTDLPAYSSSISETGQVSETTNVSGAAKVESTTVSDALKLAAVRETISGFPRAFIPAPALESVIKPKSVLSTQVATQPQTETAVSQSAPTSIGSVIEEQQIEELMEEEVAVANSDAQIQSEEAEDIKEIKIQRVVDEPVMKQREHEIISAVRLASDEIAQEIGKDTNTDANTGVEISGETVGEFLPAQHKGNRSGELNIVDPDEKLLDGTSIATFKDIVSMKFTSVIDAIKRVPRIVAKHRPVTRGEGQLVTDEDVAKVYFQYKGRIPPAQEVIKRVIRMVKQVRVVKRGQNPVQIIPIQEEVIESSEGTLQSQSDLAAALLSRF